MSPLCEKRPQTRLESRRGRRHHAAAATAATRELADMHAARKAGELPLTLQPFTLKPLETGKEGSQGCFEEELQA